MASDDAVIGLIHLSAWVAAISIVSARMDRTHDDRPDEFAASLREAQPIAEEIMLRLGLDKPLDAKWQLTTIFPACIICLVAHRPIELGGVRSLLHWGYRQFHIPFFVYFSSAFHKIAIGTIAAITIILFFALVASLLWDFGWIENVAALRGCYFLLFGFSVWIIATSIISPFISKDRLIAKCRRLENAISVRFAKRLEKAKRTVELFEGQN